MNSKMASEYESVASALSGIASHAERLARGLENLAPAAAASASVGTVHYLHAIASQLEMEGNALLQKSQPGSQAALSCEELIEYVTQSIQGDAGLRERFQVGARFRFVNDRLQALLVSLQALAKELSSVAVMQEGHADKAGGQLEAGKPVFVYIYNAQGAVLRTWSAMLTPKAFHEYSVSRPVYATRQEVEAIISSKSNPVQHAFITVEVRESDILTGVDTPVRVKEGALRVERVVVFTHNGQEYRLEQGELVKKD